MIAVLAVKLNWFNRQVIENFSECYQLFNKDFNINLAAFALNI